MYSFKLIYFHIFILSLYEINGQISDKRICADLKCEEVISTGKTTLNYYSRGPGILSFQPNQKVNIYSKEAGSINDLWGVEINGKRGYAPKMYIKETRIFKKPEHLVDTESNADKTPQVPVETIQPQKVHEAYEVHDGTTIYLYSDNETTPNIESSTAAPSNVATPETPTTVKQAEESVEVKETTKSNEDSTANTIIPNSPDGLKENTAENDAEDDENDEDDEDGDVEDENDEEEEDSEEVEKNNSIKTEEQVQTNDNRQDLSDSDNNNEHINLNVVNNASDNLEINNLNTLETNNNQENVQLLSETPKEQVVTEIPINLEENSPLIEEVTPNPVEDVKLNENTTVVMENTNAELVQNEEITPNLENVVDTVSETSKVEDVSDINSTLDTQTEKLDEIKPDLNEIETKSTETVETKPEIDVNNLNTETEKYTNSESQPNVSEIENVSNEKTEKVRENPDNNKQMPPFSLFNKNSVQNTVNNIKEDELNIESTTDKHIESIENHLEKESETNSYVNDVPIVENIENMQETSSEDVKNVKETEETTIPDHQTPENSENVVENDSPGFFDGVFSFFSSGNSDESRNDLKEPNNEPVEKIHDSYFSSHDNKNEEFCTNNDCKLKENNYFDDFFNLDMILSSNVLLYLVTTALSVILFLLGYTALDKNKHVSPLVARINQLEQQLLITMKENELLQEKSSTSSLEMNGVPSGAVQELNQRLAEMQIAKTALEEQVQSLEKELDTSTEVGIELNRILSEILSSSNANDTIKENVEQLQRQLVEQQDTINTVNETLSLKETENHELHLELEISSKKVTDLQSELDKMVDKLLKIEEERDQQQSVLETEIAQFKKTYEETVLRENALKNEVQLLTNKLSECERVAEVKIKEYNILKNSLKDIKSIKNDKETLKSLLDLSATKAEMEQLKIDNKNFIEKLQQEQEAKELYIKQTQKLAEETQVWRSKFEEIDKEKLEVTTKLDVLNNYFKEKEAQLQKEIAKYESMWVVKEGEATSTTERIKYMQEELQNYKAQNESLKQEIISQEVELKSQISLLEKKVHENWVSARQIERKLQDSQQECAQLRNRLTMRERALNDKSQNHFSGLSSPIEQNGDLALSPHPGDSPASPPPLLYGGRDLLTKSPPIPGLPPPFLPPPPGGPFMPLPMPGMPPMFMPPPFPGDHRPPPLGRLSSPPLSPRYSPDSSAFSPYDRHSPPGPPSPLYDSEFDMSPTVNYNQYDRREYKRMPPPPPLRNGRNAKGSNNGSVGSDHSNDSMKVNRKHPKV